MYIKFKLIPFPSFCFRYEVIVFVFFKIPNIFSFVFLADIAPKYQSAQKYRKWQSKYILSYVSVMIAKKFWVILGNLPPLGICCPYQGYHHPWTLYSLKPSGQIELNSV